MRFSRFSSLFSAAVLLGAAGATVAVDPGVSKRAVLVYETTAKPRSYARRRLLMGGYGSRRGTPFLTRGNRAQRARQMNGFQALA